MRLGLQTLPCRLLPSETNEYDLLMSSHVYTLIGKGYDMSVNWYNADLQTKNYHTETYQPMSLGSSHRGRVRASLLPGKTKEYDLLMLSHIYIYS